MMTHASPARASRITRRVAAGAFVLFALLALRAPAAQAGSDERTGTSGAPELLIAVGPRGTALGSAAASDVAGIEAAYWNPAGLARLDNTEALFSHTQYFADMRLNYAAVGVKAGNFGNLGFSAKVLSVGDVIVTTEQSPDGTGEVLNPTFTVLGMTWARQFTDRVNFGATIGYVNEHIANVSASGIAADFGVQYTTDWKGLVLGMSIKNIGTTMAYNGEGFETAVQAPGSESGSATRVVRFTSSNFEMPSYFTLATSGDAYRQGGVSLRWLGAFQNNNFGGDNFDAGLEWLYRDLFALRGSWFGTFNTTTDELTDEDSTKFKSGDDLYSGYAIGGGVTVKPGNTKLSVDITWRPVREFFDDIVDVGVRLRF
ncbi:MAG: PorV/PorQ family protein [Candidatus Eisenbacteria bacterium]